MVNRIRENGTKEFSQLGRPEDRITSLRIIMHDRRYALVEGVMVDTYTASAILSVYERLSEENRRKYISRSIAEMGVIAFKLLNKK